MGVARVKTFLPLNVKRWLVMRGPRSRLVEVVCATGLRTADSDANRLSGKFVVEAAIRAAGMLGTREAAPGRVREVTNGSFGAAKLVESLGT